MYILKFYFRFVPVLRYISLMFFLLSSFSDTSLADPFVWQVGDPSLAVERDVYMYRSYIALR